MMLWAKLKRIGVYMFFIGLAVWLLAEIWIVERHVNQIVFMTGWVVAIIGAVLNGVAVVKERFFSD